MRERRTRSHDRLVHGIRSSIWAPRAVAQREAPLVLDRIGAVVDRHHQYPAAILVDHRRFPARNPPGGRPCQRVVHVRVPFELAQRHPCRRRQDDLAAQRAGDGLVRRHPDAVRRLAIVVRRDLSGGHACHEEPRVEPAAFDRAAAASPSARTGAAHRGPPAAIRPRRPRAASGRARARRRDDP